MRTVEGDDVVMGLRGEERGSKSIGWPKRGGGQAFYLIFDYLTILLFVFEIGLFCALTDYLRIQIVFPKLFGLEIVKDTICCICI